MPALRRRHRHHHHPGAMEGRHTRYYDVVARRLRRGRYRRMAADVAADMPAGAAVLDAGTGPGVLLMELRRQRPDLRLAGIDLSGDMVAAAERNLKAADGVEVRVADVADLPFQDASFDLIVSSLSLHHWEDLPGAAGQIARVLRPGGRLLVYDLQFAPFEELTGAARATSRFPDEPQQALFRIGFPFPRRYVRYELTASA